ncbi:MAG: ion transporter [candidate division Zixibacteria bacterium]|nr:ion transporter [candidate division Zixibacteria bacterium]
MRLKRIIEENDTTAGKAFDLIIQFLIIVSLISFSIETIPGLSKTTLHILKTIEVTTISVFSLEYMCRLYVADKKLKFIFSFYGIIDLLAILPFYIAHGIDLRSIRILRLFRLFRVFKVFRYSQAIIRLKQAFLTVKEELVLFLMATGLLLYISSIGIYYFENDAQPEHFKSIFHCMWWAIVTLTTVGYGDVYPITTGGRIFTSIVALIGIGVVAVPTGLIASALTKIIKKEY